MAEAEVFPFAEPGVVSERERRWLIEYYQDPFAGSGVRAKALGFASPNSRTFRELENRLRGFVRGRSQAEAARWTLLQRTYRTKPAPWQEAVPGDAPYNDGSETPAAAEGSVADGKNGAEPGAMVRYGGAAEVPTREKVLLRIENMHQILESQLQRALEGDGDPVLAQGALKGMLETVKELAKGVGANKEAEPEPPATPVFLGVPREESIEDFCKRFGFVVVEDAAVVLPNER